MEINYIIILIVALIMIAVIMAIEIPISMKINRTNNKVLSCFGIIQTSQLKTLLDRCETFF